MSTDPRKPKDAVFFLIMFLACLIGSVGLFFWIAGIETGEPIVTGMFQVLLEHATVITVVFLVMNVILIGLVKTFGRTVSKEENV